MEGYRLDIETINDITDGYGERMRRLALFDPLSDLDRKRETDLNKQPIDMKGLGLLTLLFFFEQKLMRQYKTGAKELAQFLSQVVQGTYQLDGTDYERLARSLIDTFRPGTGRKREYRFYNWDKQQHEVIDYSILKANNFDHATNVQFYTLDEDGLELIFATKEFYSEFQLSINQLMLRKQLEKGEYKGALRQINEMVVDVETLEERINRLKKEIQRSIVSEETFERYKDLLDDIYNRLQREDEEFEELRQFVTDTRKRLFSQDLHIKEKQNYQLIIKITRELESVHYQHSELLHNTIELKNTTLITAQESLYYTGIQVFNFDHDIVSQVVSTPLPLDAMKGILQPFLKVEENLLWSPLTLFADQNIIEEQTEHVENVFYQIDDNSADIYQQRLMANYEQIMALFVTSYDQENVRSLGEFIQYLKEMDLQSIYNNRYFYDFWIILHQRSPVASQLSIDDDDKSVIGKALQHLAGRTLTVKEVKEEIIRATKRFSIQEFTIRLERDEGEL